MGRRTRRAAVACALAVSAAACGGSGTPRDALLVGTVPTQVTLQAHRIGSYGSVITDAGGHALYMFPPDAGLKVTCTGPCAGTWPPVVVRSGTGVHAAAGVDAHLIGTLPDPNSGARIVTYGGYPVYRYAGDVDAGTARGQGIFVDGGPWYLLTPAGDPITTDPAGT